MQIRESIGLAESTTVGAVFRPNLRDEVVLGRARLTVEQLRPTRFLADGSPDLTSYERVGDVDEVWNQITNSGRDFLHQQGYATSGIGTNGLNWIALTNTAITPAAGDTTLSGEITTNGLARAQGVVAHTAGTNITTVANTFTCVTAAQAAQAAALFTASSAGTMNHELTFPQRSLQVNDQLVLTFQITLG
jgi:hypothetical protein